MDKKYSAPAVDKMLTIIELLSKNPDGFSINELARLSEASVNSIYRICLELEGRNYLVKDPVTGFYYLGSAFYFIGKAAEKRIDLRNNAIEAMRGLKRLTGETVHLTVLSEYRMILLEQIETENNIRIQVNVGASLYPHASAFGKCLLAHAGEDFVRQYAKDSLVRLTCHTLTDYSALVGELDTIRSVGVAYDREEYMDGVMCVGSPVFGLGGKCVAAMGVIIPKYRTDEGKIREFTEYVRNAAKEISLKMGNMQ